MPVPEAANQFPHPARCVQDPPGEPELCEPAEFDPCLETLKVMNRLMAEFFNVEEFAAGEKGKTQIAGRSETENRPIS